jgi:hypothetical protein
LTLTFCYAEQQPDRGRFRPQVLKALLGRRKRWVPYLLEHQDLVQQEDGRLYVVGWDEWQEGDWQVAERMRRVRNRRYGPDRNTSNDPNRNGSAARIKEAVAVGIKHSPGPALHYDDPVENCRAGPEPKKNKPR